jgi:hypothetical protein
MSGNVWARASKAFNGKPLLKIAESPRHFIMGGWMRPRDMASELVSTSKWPSDRYTPICGSASSGPSSFQVVYEIEVAKCIPNKQRCGGQEDCM